MSFFQICSIEWTIILYRRTVAPFGLPVLPEVKIKAPGLFKSLILRMENLICRGSRGLWSAKKSIDIGLYSSVTPICPLN